MGRKRKLRQIDSAISEAIAEVTQHVKAHSIISTDERMRDVAGLVEQYGPLATRDILALELIQSRLGGDRNDRKTK